jgi:hypothetical protein
VFPDTGDPLYLAGGQPRPLFTTAISRNLEEDLDPADDGQVFRTCFFIETPSSFTRCSFCGSKCKISNKWLLNEWSTTKLFFSRKGYHLHHHHRLISAA